MRTDIIFNDDVLYINIEGSLNRREVGHLKKKMYSVISEYGIGDVVIDIKGTTKVDRDAFYSMLDDYDNIYGGNLKIKE